MRGLTQVILACFAVALGQKAGTDKLSAATELNSKIPIQCIHAITDFCYMIQYCNNTHQTIGYINEYLHQFHKSKNIFVEFQTSKSDREDVVKVGEKIVEGQT